MKPHVICHMISPLDGRLVVQSWAPEATDLNKQMIAEYERIHDEFGADAWLAGTTTMQEFAPGSAATGGVTDGPAPRPWHLADTAARHFAIAIDRKGTLHWASPKADKGHVVVIVGASIAESHLLELMAAKVSYLAMPTDNIDLASMLEEIHARLGINTLLLEGGATMNGAFLKAGLVDEVSLLMCPTIDGSSGKSAIFEAGRSGVGQNKTLELKSATPGVSNTCHLRYRMRAD